MSKQAERLDSGTSAKANLDFNRIITDEKPQTAQSTTSYQSEFVLSAKKPFRTIIRGMKDNDQDNPS